MYKTIKASEKIADFKQLLELYTTQDKLSVMLAGLIEEMEKNNWVREYDKR